MPVVKPLLVACAVTLALPAPSFAQTWKEIIEQRREERRDKIIAEAKAKARAKIEAAVAAKVAQAQRALTYFGFDAGPADGTLGDQTKMAIEDFTAYLGYPPLPIIGPIQIDYLMAVQKLAQSPDSETSARLQDLGGAPQTLLRSYMADPIKAVHPDPAKLKTRNIQMLLKLMGHDPGKVDGAMGPATRTAIDAWRAANGSEATGALSNAEKVALQLESWRNTVANVPMTAALRPPRESETNLLATLPDGPPAALAVLPLFYASDDTALMVLPQGDPANCATTTCTTILYHTQSDDISELGRFEFSGDLEMGTGYYGGLRDLWIDGWLYRWTGTAYDRDKDLAAAADRPAETTALSNMDFSDFDLENLDLDGLIAQ